MRIVRAVDRVLSPYASDFLLTPGEADIGFRWSCKPHGKRLRGECMQAFASDVYSSPTARFLGRLADSSRRRKA
jgi:hypothetical protein